MKESDQQRKVTLLCVSDERDPLIYSQNLKERYGHVDAVIGAGDLPMEYYGFIVSMINKPLLFVFGNHQLRYYQRFKEIKNFLLEYDHQQGPGGVQRSPVDYFGSTHIGGKVVYRRNMKLIIAGMGGSRRYNDGENQYTEFQMLLKLLQLIPAMLFQRIRRGRWLDILVTHAPPKDIHDKSDPCHRGFSVFLWFMRVFKPRYLLHGHTHLHDINENRITRYQETEVINVFQRYVLEVTKSE